MSGGEIGPGDSFSVSLVIISDAIEEMYVFVEIQMSEYLASSLPESEDALPLYLMPMKNGYLLKVAMEQLFMLMEVMI